LTVLFRFDDLAVKDVKLFLQNSEELEPCSEPTPALYIQPCLLKVKINEGS